MTNSTKDMVDLIDVSNLNLVVGHPHKILSKIIYVGNFRLNNDEILFNVLVVHEYTDLRNGRVLRFGSEIGGLYLFDKEYNKSDVSNNSKFFACNVSKEVWHCNLGHPANQVLKLLKGSLNLTNIDHNGPYEVCHKAKQTSDSFLMSENKSTVFGQLIHLVFWVLIKKPIGIKWVFRIKYKSTGEVKRFKARLVVKGFNQREGLEYEETFIPIVKMDISYVVHCLSQHMHASLKSHFDIGLRVLRYVKPAPGSGIDFAKNKSEKSKKRATLSKSSAEAEYRVMTSTTCIQIAVNPVMHEKIKHFDINVHLVREKVGSSLIITEKVDSKNQTAGILNKALGSAQHTTLTKKLGMVNLFVS
uniref:Ribonuclease H-like domain-containing protein n=1 Tax=Tanacetum cinerariifolium TaxID=118510 RepID=A0A699I977_TANCI|nr:ribonuclease H-like domain-containing protein [Tanacetum cinerariifolium]